jgi:hypothetical protein
MGENTRDVDNMLIPFANSHYYQMENVRGNFFLCMFEDYWFQMEYHHFLTLFSTSIGFLCREAM